MSPAAREALGIALGMASIIAMFAYEVWHQRRVAAREMAAYISAVMARTARRVEDAVMLTIALGCSMEQAIRAIEELGRALAAAARQEVV